MSYDNYAEYVEKYVYKLETIVGSSNIAVEYAREVYAALDKKVKAFTGTEEQPKDEDGDCEETSSSLYEKLDKNIGDIRFILSRMSDRLKAL